MQLSKLENRVYEELRKNNFELFGIKEICQIFGFDKIKAYNIIKALKKKKAVMQIKAGAYSFNDISDYFIGANLNWPSYLSFWSALSYYGFSDNLPKEIFFASRKYHKKIKNFKYVFMNNKKFFGYIKIGNIVIADKEKAIVDSLVYPKYSGGMPEIKNCLQRAIEDLDISKLMGYIKRVNVKIIKKRLRSILIESGYSSKKFLILKKHLIKLK